MEEACILLKEGEKNNIIIADIYNVGVSMGGPQFLSMNRMSILTMKRLIRAEDRQVGS